MIPLIPAAAMDVMMEETFGPIIGIQKVDYPSVRYDGYVVIDYFDRFRQMKRHSV